MPDTPFMTMKQAISILMGRQPAVAMQRPSPRKEHSPEDGEHGEEEERPYFIALPTTPLPLPPEPADDDPFINPLRAPEPEPRPKRARQKGQTR